MAERGSLCSPTVPRPPRSSWGLALLDLFPSQNTAAALDIQRAMKAPLQLRASSLPGRLGRPSPLCPRPFLGCRNRHHKYVAGVYTVCTMTSTTIRIDTETRDELQSLGRMGESYDDVIRRLLSAAHGRDGGSTEPALRMGVLPQRPLFPRPDRG